MRLIDADVLKQGVNGVSTHWLNEWSTLGVLAMVDKQPTVDAVPVCVLKEILMRYFDIGDSYHFELTRVKEAFEVGTISVDDFQEWTEENVDDLVNYIKKNGSYGERKGGGE